MQISSDYSLENIYSLTSPTQTSSGQTASGRGLMDTVSISEEAMAAYRKSKTATGQTEEDDSTSASALFKKAFNSYRGKGIFSEDESAVAVSTEMGQAEAAEQGADGGQGAGGSGGSGNIEEIQAKIKSLSSMLQSILSSSAPDDVKNSQAAPIQAQINELQAQLNSAS